MKTLLTKSTIATMNSKREILEGYDLLIEDGRILKIAPQGSIARTDLDGILDCEGRIIIPGLVSAHTHLTNLFQRGLWDETSYEIWRNRTQAMERLMNLSAEEIYAIHCAACVELLQHGVTTVLHMFDMRSDVRLEKFESAYRALSDTGIRGILALSLLDQSPDNESIAVARGTTDRWMSFAREAAERVVGLNSRVTFMLAPSAPQRCSDQLLIRCKELAEELNVGIHSHLAETKMQAEVGRHLYGVPIVNHLEKIGFLNSNVSVAHSIWLEDNEIDLLKKYDVKIVHSPASNMKLGSGIAPVKKMLRKGLTVGLGVDCANAGTIYSVFEQMKLCVLLPRTLWRPEKWIRPDEAFEMGTLGGARAVLQTEMIGSLEQGKKADLVVLKPQSSLIPVNDLINQLVLCENGSSVESVFVDGKAVMLRGRIKTIREEDVMDALSSLNPRILEAKDRVLEREK